MKLINQHLLNVVFIFCAFLNLASAQTTKLPEAQQTLVSTQQVAASEMNFRPEMRLNAYKLRIVKPLADDGFPVRYESFAFTSDEMSKLTDIEVVKKALQREQRRITALFFQGHLAFSQYKPSHLKELIDSNADSVDKGIQELKNFDLLNTFTVELLRNHLLRVSSYIVNSRHLQYINVTGDEKVSLIKRLIPNSPFEYMAAISFVLSLLLAMDYAIKRA